MKKQIVFILAVVMALSFTTACKKKIKEIPPPPAPQATEQPRVEKVVEQPVVKEPGLSEEDVFLSKSLEQINKEQPLQIVFFDYDKYSIRADARPILESNAEWLKKYKTVKILIEGHCDERGTEEYNLALGERRANSAMEYLLALGISGDRMRTISYGKSQPLAYGHDEASWQKNRRGQFIIIEK